MDIALAQPVLRPVLGEALAGIDQEHALAGGGVLLVQHQDAGGNAGAIEEVRGQADDAFQDAGADELFADHGLGISPEQHAVRQDASGLSRAIHAAEDVQQVGVVALLRRRLAPGEALELVVRRREAGGPGLVGERRIGDDVVVGAERGLAVLELGIGEGVAGKDVRRGEVVKDHVHPRETGGGDVLFLALQRDVLPRLGGHLQQQRAGPAGGVVGAGAALGIVRADADDLGDDPADLAGRVELALALAALRGEVPHEVLVGVAEDVIVLRAVLREIQLRLLEDGDEAGEAVHHFLAFTELVRVVEVGEIRAGEPGIRRHQRGDDLLVDAVADVGLALHGDHVGEAGPGRDHHRRLEVLAVAVFVGDVFDEEQEEDVVLVLAGIHAAAQRVAGGPDGGVEVGFLERHRGENDPKAGASKGGIRHSAGVADRLTRGGFGGSGK